MGALALRTIHYDTETGAVNLSWSQAVLGKVTFKMNALQYCVTP